VLNVVTGERYKVVPNEVKQYVKGYYGAPPAPIDEKVKRKVIGSEEPITCRPADLLKPEFDKARKELDGKVASDEDVLSYVLFPQVALNFFEMRELKNKGLNSSDSAIAALASAVASQLMSKPKLAPTAAPQAMGQTARIPSPWALAGRQELMRARTTIL
jgi:pyruvate/oxaloacetate carboxyltransferase